MGKEKLAHIRLVSSEPGFEPGSNYTFYCFHNLTNSGITFQERCDMLPRRLHVLFTGDPDLKTARLRWGGSPVPPQVNSTVTTGGRR